MNASGVSADRTARRPAAQAQSRAGPCTYQPLLTCKVDVKWVFGFSPLRRHTRVYDYLAPPVQTLDEGSCGC